MVRNLPANGGDASDVGSIPGLGRSPGGRNGNPFRYSWPGKSHGQKSPRGHRAGHGCVTVTLEAPTLDQVWF